eukprot:8473624-Pyramimonas_sp.AAC.1
MVTAWAFISRVAWSSSSTTRTIHAGHGHSLFTVPTASATQYTPKVVSSWLSGAVTLMAATGKERPAGGLVK